MTTAVYHMGGNLWVERHGEHAYIKDNDTDDVIVFFIPQGDCERVAETLLEIARKRDAEEQRIRELDKLQRLVTGAGLPGDEGGGQTIQRALPKAMTMSGCTRLQIATMTHGKHCIHEVTSSTAAGV